MTAVQRIDALAEAAAPLSGSTGLKDAQFLGLLIAELRNQDPLKPMADREFIGQLAQLRTLEQTEQMNKTLSTLASSFMVSQASSFIGKQVKGDAGDGLVSGVVNGVVVQGKEVSAEVNGQLLPVSKITHVYEAPSGEGGQVVNATAP